jgi:hypothetical protein
MVELAKKKKKKKVTNFTEQSSSSEANSISTNQETDHFVWNQKVHYRKHRSPPIGSCSESD